MRRAQYNYRAMRDASPPPPCSMSHLAREQSDLGWVWVAAQAVASIASSFKWKPKGVVDPKTAEKVFASLIPPIEGADWDKYLALYPDVLKAYQTPGHKFQQLVDAAGMHPGEFHFRSGGHAEGRKLVPLETAPEAPPVPVVPLTPVAPPVATPVAPSSPAPIATPPAAQQVLPQLPPNIPNMAYPSPYVGASQRAQIAQSQTPTWLIPAMIAGAALLLFQNRGARR